MAIYTTWYADAFNYSFKEPIKNLFEIKLIQLK